MVKSPNNLQISVPLSIREKLQLMAVDNESVSLVAKRILLEALGENSEASTAIAPDALEEIRDRLNKLEEQKTSTEQTHDFLEKVMNENKFDLLAEHGDRLNQLETGQPEFHESIANLVERLENIEGWISSFRQDRTTGLEIQKIFQVSLELFNDRLDALEAVSTKKPESQSDKGMTHTALAEKLGLDRSTVTRWRNDRAKWPEGYIWSDESKKWFPLEMPTDSIKTAKGLNHQEMAEICGVSLFEVTKLIHDSSKWPEGYLWSNESKKWFPMEV